MLRKLERVTNAVSGAPQPTLSALVFFFRRIHLTPALFSPDIEGKDAYSRKSNHQAANLSKVIAKVKESLGGTATPQAQFNLALPRIKGQQVAATHSLLKTAKSVSVAMAQSRTAALDPRIKASMHAAIDKYF